MAQPCRDNLSEKDPYDLYMSPSGDEFNVYEPRRGILEGNYGGYTSLCSEDRAFYFRPLFYLPRGERTHALLTSIVQDVLTVRKEGLVVSEAFKKDSVVLRVYLSFGVFGFSLAATFTSR